MNLAFLWLAACAQPAPEVLDACSGCDALAALDPRAPVPLEPRMAAHQKAMMREHLVGIQRIVDGLAREDWEAIATAAQAFGTSPAMRTQCEHMGEAAPGFTDRALAFHRRVDGIADAARQHDGPAVLRATSDALAACTDCHATYRQQVEVGSPPP